MRQPARIAPTPLFDRLIGTESLTQDLGSLSALDLDGVKASIARELERLLVSRSRRPRSEMTRERTVIDYGVADHFMFDPRSADDRKQLGDELEDLITVYEPRLQRVRVYVEEPNDVDTRLHLTLEAFLVVGEVKEPLSFRIVKRGDFLEVSK